MNFHVIRKNHRGVKKRCPPKNVVHGLMISLDSFQMTFGTRLE